MRKGFGIREIVVLACFLRPSAQRKFFADGAIFEGMQQQ